MKLELDLQQNVVPVNKQLLELNCSLVTLRLERHDSLNYFRIAYGLFQNIKMSMCDRYRIV